MVHRCYNQGQSVPSRRCLIILEGRYLLGHQICRKRQVDLKEVYRFYHFTSYMFLVLKKKKKNLKSQFLFPDVLGHSVFVRS